DVLGDAPSVHAAYRFIVKLREHSAALAGCLDRVLAGLPEAIPDLGANLAIDRVGPARIRERVPGPAQRQAP
ncbi:MAG: hypothetical protein ACRDTH_13380, partial [Pseudonocardiaceae bacterium]